MTMIDMHAHWRPAELADALRARTREPRILRNDDGVEVLTALRMGEEPLAKAFDDVDFHLARMDRQGVETSVLSLLGSFCWIEAQPPEESAPLCRIVNDGLSAICQKHPGRFAAYAALRPCCMDQPVDAVIPCPHGLMRCGRSSGVPAPAYGSGHRQQLPLQPLDARWFASAVHDR
jgi:hypothetical protein